MSAEYSDQVFGASESFQRLAKFLNRVGSDKPSGQDSFECFERELHRHVLSLEAELLGREAERYDVDSEEIEVFGETFRRKGRFPKEYHGLAGSFRIERSLYCPKNGRGRALVPLELRAGIVEGAWTPRLARVMARTVSAATPKEAAAIFEEFGGATPSTSSLDRLPKQLSEVWESQREAFEDEIRSLETVPAEAVAVAVGLDGVLIPMKAEPRAGSTKRRGPTDYQEASCGTISFYDAEGERLSTVRYARAPEHKKKTLKSQLEEELKSIYAVRPDLCLVCLSDGAQDHWEFFSQLAETVGATDVRRAADFFHVVERVKKALDAYHGEGTAESHAEFERCRVLLKEKEDGADRVIRALRYRRDRSRHSKRQQIAKQITYLENRKADSLLDYKTLLDEKLPIGSGVVEAACKPLASQRLKCSGMSWSYRGAEGILTLRSLVQSERWSPAWDLLAAHYRPKVSIRRRRAA